MAIMDFFKNPSTPAPANAGPTGTPPVATGTPNPAPNTNAGNTNGPDGTNTFVNPLDAYTKLFDNANKNLDTPPSFSLDPKVLGEVSGNMDFTQGISPEMMQQATSGDAKALISIIQHVGRQTYQAAMTHNSALTDKFVGARSAYDQKSLGSKVKSELTSSALAQAPSFSHPVVRQELTRIATAMQAENPDASPQQIADAAQKYFTDIYSAVTPQPTAAEQRATKGEIDWDNYFKSTGE